MKLNIFDNKKEFSLEKFYEIGWYITYSVFWRSWDFSWKSNMCFNKKFILKQIELYDWNKIVLNDNDSDSESLNENTNDSDTESSNENIEKKKIYIK